ncbi:MAG: orotidine-5'-phosphate decarboxylase [Chromatiales bacterium]|jgi:orotidine-5'-phosphate decarboxylase|nr:orotidine-5'-phosphate decarboxylase [Chromatiales bacterium]MDX9765715.1 orotidine-5'-phosphate decarboxylase [Ectothiorhodospiraceae bacterium]
MSTSSRIIVALDFPDAAAAMKLVERLDPSLCRLKVGFELFVSAGPGFVERLAALGYQVFLDLKFHDIPNTVASVCRVATGLGVWMLNVHALGGKAMMEAAREAVGGGAGRPLLIAVTVLTSMDGSELQRIGIDRSPVDAVTGLARLASDCGLDGVVCSAQEASVLRTAMGDAFLLVTPGIRPADTATDDQRRIMTPAAAIRAGASHLVVGRPVSRAADPRAALEGILREIA